MSTPPNTFVDTPIASHTLAQDQPVIRSDFTYLANTLGTSNSKNGDHQIGFGGTDTTTFEGRHRQVCLNNRTGSPPTVAAIGDGTNALIYSDAGNIFFGTALGAGNFKMTTFNTQTLSNTALFGATTNGYTFLPGGLMLQYGRITSPASSGTVLFNTANINFQNALFSVFFNFSRNASGVDSFWIDSTQPFNSSQFSWKASTGSAAFLYWVAIGN